MKTVDRKLCLHCEVRLIEEPEGGELKTVEPYAVKLVPNPNKVYPLRWRCLRCGGDWLHVNQETGAS